MNASTLKWIERSIQSLLLQYEEADPKRKNEILHLLHDEYHALPVFYQEKLWKLWLRWLAVFEEEEIAAGTITVRHWSAPGWQ